MGEFVGLLELAENFRLAEHHRVDAARHAEKVIDTLRVAVRVQFVAGRRVDAVEVAKKPAQRLAKRGVVVTSRGINLDTVARGENHCFVGDALLAHLAKRVGDLCVGKGKALPQFDGR